MVLRQGELCFCDAGQLFFGFLSCSSGLVVLAAADTVLFSAGVAPGLAGYCGAGAVFAFARCLVGFFCGRRDVWCRGLRVSLFVELSLGFLPRPSGGRVPPVLFGAGLASSAARQSRVGAVPASAGLAGCFPFLPSALPVVFLPFGSLAPGSVVFPAVFGPAGWFLRSRVFRWPPPLGIPTS